MSPLKAKSKADLDTRSESETTAASTEASREGEGDAGALPPAIQRAIRTLSEQGFSITAENMKHLSHKARKDAFMALQNGLRAKAPDELGKYKMVTGQDEKRQWLARFMLDPSCAGLKGRNTFAKETEDVEGVDFVWITKDTMAGPSYLNNAVTADLACADCASRPYSRSESAASAGVLEYKYYFERGSHKRRSLEKTEVSAEADVNDEDYTKIREATQSVRVGHSACAESSLGSDRPPPKRLKNTKTMADRKAELDAKLESMSAEDRAQYDQQQQLKEVNAWVVKERTAIKRVESVKALLKSKGKWGVEAANSLQVATDEQLDSIEKVFRMYNGILELPPESRSEQHAALLVAKKDAEESIARFKKNQLADFDRLSGSHVNR